MKMGGFVGSWQVDCKPAARLQATWSDFKEESAARLEINVTQMGNLAILKAGNSPGADHVSEEDR
jgi:hypothetical protein